jgi:hypothetical protein
MEQDQLIISKETAIHIIRYVAHSNRRIARKLEDAIKQLGYESLSYDEEYLKAMNELKLVTLENLLLDIEY